MSTQQPTANTMSLQAIQPVETKQEKEQQQPEVLRLRGGGNACADCLA